jgi:hypothetical protein
MATTAASVGVAMAVVACTLTCTAAINQSKPKDWCCAAAAGGRSAAVLVLVHVAMAVRACGESMATMSSGPRELKVTEVKENMVAVAVAEVKAEETAAGLAAVMLT